jgi:putative membrane protein
MKTQATLSLAVLLAAAPFALAQERVIPTDPGAQSGNTGAAGAHGQATDPIAPRMGDRLPADGVNTDGATSAQESDRAEPAVGVQTPSRDDRQTLQKLARLNHREASFSRLASENATDPQVRAFASEMVREHEQAAQELALLASRKGATQDATQLDESSEDRQELARKTGSDFDKAYVKAMSKAHEESAEALEQASRSNDPEVAAFANRMLPKIRDHHERAKNLKRSDK